MQRNGFSVQPSTTRAPRGNLRLAVLGIAACTAALAGGVFAYRALARSSVFAVRELAITGADAPTRGAIVTAVQGAVGGRSLLRVQAAQVARAIEQVPAIATASVDRDFPSTLRIRIVPERAILRLCPMVLATLVR